LGQNLPPADFDCLDKTVAALAHFGSGLPRHFLHCMLDDTPIVFSKGQPGGNAFADNYRCVCQEIGLALAADDPNRVKAFSRQTKGTIIDTFKGTWLLPEENFEDVARLG